MIKMMSYCGSKYNFVQKFNDIIINNKNKVYYEPFIGSGSIFVNLPNKFDRYIINDIDENIVGIWKSIQIYSFDDFVRIKKEICKDFGNIKDDIDSYYNFRNWWNVEHFNFDKKFKFIYLYVLANSCINSFIRFGKNGMNSSFGNRDYFFSNTSYDKIKYKLEKTSILNCSYDEINYSDNGLIFLDPPYSEREGSYSNNFNDDELNNFLKFVNNISNKNNVIYTDIENKIIDDKLQNFNKYIIIDMINTSPNRKSDKGGVEYMKECAYYNFKYFDKNERLFL